MSALLYAVTAAAAIAGLRFVTPLSRRAMVVLALLPLCLTGRALLTGRIYAPIDIAYTNEPLASLAEESGITRVLNPAASDVFSQFLPWHAAMRDSVRHGQWPLWNRFDSVGHPLLGAAQVAPLHPVTLLGLLLPPPDEPTFAASMLYLLAALSMFAFLRELTLGELAASFGAAAWMLSTYLISFAGTSHGLSLSILPFVLLGARRAARKANVRSLIVLTAALLLLVLSGHPETTLHVVALAVAFFAFEWLPRPRRNAIAVGLGAGAITLCLAAIYLLPILDTIDQTREVQERSANLNSHSGSTELAHRLRVNLLPFLEGQHGEPAMHGDVHGWFSTSYSGSLLFAPAIYALLFVRDRRRRFFGGLLLFGLAAGVKMPGVADVLERIPGFSIALNERMISFAAFAIAVLAAIGVDEFIKEKRKALAMLFIGTAIVVVIAFIAAQPVIHEAALSRSFVRLHALRMLAPLFFGAAIALGIRSRRHAAIALLALLLMQRAGETSTLQPTLPRSAWYPRIAALDPIVRSNDVFRIAATGAMLPPNIAAHYGLEDARGYEAMTLERAGETLPIWSASQPVWSNRVDDLTAPMLTMLNVRYALAPLRTATPAGWSHRATGRGFELFENDHVLPRAFVPRVIHFAPRARILAAMRSCRDFASEGWIESDGEERTIVNGGGRIDVARNASQLRIDASMTSAAWVIVSENAWRGWRALDRGNVIPIRVGNDAFLAMHLDAGEHKVTLAYWPHAFVIGRAITLASITVLLIAFALLRPVVVEDEDVGLEPLSA